MSTFLHLAPRRPRSVRLREAAGMAVVPAAPGEMLRIGAVQLQVEVPQESAIQRGRRDGMKFGEVMSFFDMDEEKAG